MTSSPTPQAIPDRPWSPAAERIAIIAFWSFLAALEFLRRTVDPFAAQIGAVAYAGMITYLVWAVLTPVIFRVARRLPLESGVTLRRLVALAGVGLVASIVVALIHFTVVGLLVDPSDFPGDRPAPPPFGPAAVILRLWFLDEFVIFLAVLAVGYARNYFMRLREREQEALSLQAQLSDARLSALRMQLNPHFLFNTLHSISSLAEDDPEGVQRIVARLSALLRRALEGTAKQEVPLRDEISFLRDYLAIQRVRFDDRLEVSEEIERDVLEALVPNLILQPLVENAIKHGAGQVADGTARIVLRARREDDRLMLSVRDNGPGLGEGAEEAAAREGRVGLANTRARLEGLYDEDAGLGLDDAPGGGLLATVTLPYHTSADLRTAPHA